MRNLDVLFCRTGCLVWRNLDVSFGGILVSRLAEFGCLVWRNLDVSYGGIWVSRLAESTSFQRTALPASVPGNSGITFTTWRKSKQERNRFFYAQLTWWLYQGNVEEGVRTNNSLESWHRLRMRFRQLTNTFSQV